MKPNLNNINNASPQIAQIDQGDTLYYGNDTLMDDTIALMDDPSAFMGIVLRMKGKANLVAVEDIKPILQSIQ